MAAQRMLLIAYLTVLVAERGGADRFDPKAIEWARHVVRSNRL